MELSTILIYLCIALSLLFLGVIVINYFKMKKVGSSTSFDFSPIVKEIDSLTALIKSFNYKEVRDILDTF
jgi:hypothetical protein